MKRVALLLILGCAVVLARNVVITNPTTQPIPIKQVASSAPIATPTASPVGTATATPTPTATASAGTGLVDGDPVSSWLDSSGAGHNATQTGTARPTFKTNVINGKPVVRFNSANAQFLNLATPYPGAGPVTIFAVKKSDPAKLLMSFTSNAWSGTLGIYLSNDAKVYVSNPVTGEINGAPRDGSFHVYCADMAVATTKFYQDGTDTALSFGAGSLPSPPYIQIGSSGNDGDIAEVIVYSGALALRAKLVLLMTALITTGEFPSPAEFDAMVGHRDKIKKYLHKHGAHPTKAQLDAVVTPMAVGDRANIEKYLGTKYGITVAGGTAADPSTIAGLQGWWKADTLSSFDPTMLAGLKAWWRADAITAPDGTGIYNWIDASGNGILLVNASGVYPIFKSGILNGKPVLRFAAGNGYLVYPNPITNQPNTIVVVGRKTGLSTDDCRFSGTVAQQMLCIGGNDYMYLYAGAVCGNAPPAVSGAFHVLTGIYSAGNGTGYLDGALQVPTGVVGTGNLTFFAMMGDGVNISYAGDVAEMLIYNTALSTTDRQKVEAYLKAKYGLP